MTHIELAAAIAEIISRTIENAEKNKMSWDDLTGIIDTPEGHEWIRKEFKENMRIVKLLNA